MQLSWAQVIEILRLESLQMSLLVLQHLRLLLKHDVGCDEQLVILEALLTVSRNSFNLLHKQVVVLDFFSIQLWHLFQAIFKVVDLLSEFLAVHNNYLIPVGESIWLHRIPRNRRTLRRVHNSRSSWRPKRLVPLVRLLGDVEFSLPLLLVYWCLNRCSYCSFSWLTPLYFLVERTTHECIFITFLHEVVQ